MRQIYSGCCSDRSYIYPENEMLRWSATASLSAKYPVKQAYASLVEGIYIYIYNFARRRNFELLMKVLWR